MDAITKKDNQVKSIFKQLTKEKLMNHLHKFRNGKNDQKASNNGYLESIEYFRQRYFIEQRRSERKDYEFCLIVIDLTDPTTNSPGDFSDSSLKKAESVLLKTAQAVLRMTDVAVTYCACKSAILLPDTNREGGQLAINRMNAMLNDVADPSIKNIFQQIKIDIYAYPLQEDEINQFIYDKLFDDTTSTIQLEKAVSKIKTYYHQNHNGNGFDRTLTDSNFRFSAVDSIALENPFCLLNEAFYDVTYDWQRAMKRVLDLILSSLAIIILLPLILIIAIGIKATSNGPVFFKQHRVGYMGKKFIIYKFRTMFNLKDEKTHQNYVQDFIHHSSADEPNANHDAKIFKMQHDPRITPIGRFLRRTSLDEIGQLVNILKGEMSLVGPRPPIPYEVDMYDLWHKRRFLAVKPGLTGLWQIYGRSATTFNDMVRLDLAYIQNWSLALDLKILIRTIVAVLSMKGAY